MQKYEFKEQRVIPDSMQEQAWPNLESFLRVDEVRPGVHSIRYGNLPIDFLYENRESDCLLVVFHGANYGVQLPWFNGRNTSAKLGLSCLNISDPSLYFGLPIKSGWFLGNRAQPFLQHYIIKIIAKVAHAAGVQKIVFLGGSSGGFAALYFSFQFPLSRALVFNPQTNLERYVGLNLEPYLEKAWGVKNLELLPKAATYNLDELYCDGSLNEVFYMQNKTDHHVQSHLWPFIRSLKESNINILVHDYAQNHEPPPRSIVTSTLRRIATTDFDHPIKGFSRAVNP